VGECDGCAQKRGSSAKYQRQPTHHGAPFALPEARVAGTDGVSIVTA